MPVMPSAFVHSTNICARCGILRSQGPSGPCNNLIWIIFPRSHRLASLGTSRRRTMMKTLHRVWHEGVRKKDDGFLIIALLESTPKKRTRASVMLLSPVIFESILWQGPDPRTFAREHPTLRTLPSQICPIDSAPQPHGSPQ